MTLVVNLTPWQQAELADAYAQIAEMSAAGAPGMLVAQLYPDHMVVGVVEHDKAKQLQTAFGARPGHISRTAFDRADGPVCNVHTPWETPQ